jgi:hypothetical protein
MPLIIFFMPSRRFIFEFSEGSTEPSLNQLSYQLSAQDVFAIFCNGGFPRAT